MIRFRMSTLVRHLGSGMLLVPAFAAAHPGHTEHEESFLFPGILIGIGVCLILIAIGSVMLQFQKKKKVEHNRERA